MSSDTFVSGLTLGLTVFLSVVVIILIMRPSGVSVVRSRH